MHPVHDKAYSVFEDIQYLTGCAVQPMTFRSYRFRPVQLRKKLVAYWNLMVPVEVLKRAWEEDMRMMKQNPQSSRFFARCLNFSGEELKMLANNTRYASREFGAPRRVFDA